MNDLFFIPRADRPPSDLDGITRALQLEFYSVCQGDGLDLRFLPHNEIRDRCRGLGGLIVNLDGRGRTGEDVCDFVRLAGALGAGFYDMLVEQFVLIHRAFRDRGVLPNPSPAPREVQAVLRQRRPPPDPQQVQTIDFAWSMHSLLRYVVQFVLPAPAEDRDRAFAERIEDALRARDGDALGGHLVALFRAESWGRWLIGQFRDAGSWVRTWLRLFGNIGRMF